MLGDGLAGSAAAACVTHPDGTTQIRTLELTDCGAEAAWLRVEASGICGTDVALAAGGLSFPAVLGHHVVGRIADIGVSASARWGVRPGDLVAVEEYLPCWSCEACRSGLYRLCPSTDLWGSGRRIGLVPMDEEPHLWGGNAQYMYLPPNAVVHRLPDDIPVALAAWTQPLANAVDWLQRVGRLQAGDTVVVLGPGYHGLAAVAVAREFGAGRVLVGGTPHDETRLQLAQQLGAETFDATSEAIVDEVRELAGGQLAHLVLDVGGSDPGSVTTGLGLLRPQGRLVVAGIKSPPLAALDTSALVRSMQTITGVRGRNPESVSRSIDLMHKGGAGLAAVPTHVTALTEVGEMLRRLHTGDGPATPHVVVRPWSTAARECSDQGATTERGNHEQAPPLL